MTVELMIQHGSTGYFPPVEEGIELSLERKGQAGELSFSIVQTDGMAFAEGDPVCLTVDGTKLFYGFIFTIKRDKDRLVSITAYDQIRYLIKNKDTIVYENKTAAELIRMIANDYGLNCGEIEETGYVIESCVEDNQSLMDMIQNALDTTLQERKYLFVLYDDYGKLTLKNVENMRVGLLIDAETGENFDYESSIDNDTYNRVKLAYDNEETGKREIYVAQNSDHINTWGLLQYFESIQSPTGAAERAEALLSLYDQKTKNLSISNAFGDLRIRAGSSVMVSLQLGDMTVNNFMVVNTVKHKFENNQHLMDLTLIGGEFIA